MSDAEAPLSVVEKYDFHDLLFREYWTKLKAMQDARRAHWLAQLESFEAQEECNFLESRIANEEEKIRELEEGVKVNQENAP